MKEFFDGILLKKCQSWNSFANYNCFTIQVKQKKNHSEKVWEGLSVGVKDLKQPRNS